MALTDSATQIPSCFLLFPSPRFFSISLSSYERYNSLGWGSIGLSGGTEDSLAFCNPLALPFVSMSTSLH